MSAPMVRAILSGAKTQTRRIVKPQPDPGNKIGWFDNIAGRPPSFAEYVDRSCNLVRTISCPYGAPGDLLWVREAFAYSVKDPDSFKNDEYTEEQYDIVYRATSEDVGEWTNYDENGNRTRIAPQWKPSIHMPRWASRITLEITGVRVERLNAISEADARAEGVYAVTHGAVGQMEPSPPRTHRQAFELLWCEINGAESWERNDWVWVIEFRRIEEHAT